MQFTITSEQILYVCAFITSVWGVVKIYKELSKPKQDLKDMVSNHEDALKDNDERLREIELTDKLILQSLLVIINHDITGNGIEQLKDVRNDLQEFLINK